MANDFAKSLPFSYAQAQGASVISNSWVSSNTYPNTTAAINAAAAAGVVVLFASGNTPANNCVDPRVGNDASVIAVSSEDTVFAELTCEGVAGLCKGQFKITGGTGRFEGVSGSGRMTVRSPIHALAADLSDGTIIHAAAGILQMPELTVKLP